MATSEASAGATVGQHKYSRYWDAWAASLSGLCLLHCLAMPVLATVVPLAAAVSEAEWMHILFVCMAAPITLWVVRRAWLQQESRWFMAIAIVALGMMVSAVTVVPHNLEEPFTVIGAGTLGVAHSWRWWQHQFQEK